MKLRNISRRKTRKRGGEVLGIGKSGIVYSPASNNGNKHYSDKRRYITKIHATKKNANNAVRNAQANNSIPKLMKKPIIPYNNPVNVNTLPPNVQEITKKTFTSLNKNHSMVYPVLLENYGVSLEEITNTAWSTIANNAEYNVEKYLIDRQQDQINKIQNIDYSIILIEILKLLKEVKYMRENDFNHGDLHAGNILINLDTGVMTIIDFDSHYYSKLMDIKRMQHVDQYNLKSALIPFINKIWTDTYIDNIPNGDRLKKMLEYIKNRFTNMLMKSYDLNGNINKQFLKESNLDLNNSIKEYTDMLILLRIINKSELKLKNMFKTVLKNRNISDNYITKIKEQLRLCEKEKDVLQKQLHSLF